ncbi:MAG: RNA polymerase sigma factor [Clostridia bacterium]|nr:RNA polymerase sigma factor [Clostridia bacterium]
MEDSRIVALYLARKECAIGETAGKYGKRLQKLSFDIVHDRRTAEECENDTYLAAWNSIPPHEPFTYLYAFLARITRHVSLNVCKKEHRLKRDAYLVTISAELEQCIPSPDDMECRADVLVLRDAVNAFLGELDAEKRKIFLRRYWYLDSVAAIAARYAMTPGKVKSVLFRCREKLRETLEKEGISI